jgi:hypothetical protein
MNDLSALRRRRDDGLGPNTDIGRKLRALFATVEDQGIPPHLLDLLDRLDEVERQSSVHLNSATAPEDGE